MMAGAEGLAGANDDRHSRESFGTVPRRYNQKATAHRKGLEALLPHRGPARILNTVQSRDRAGGDHPALPQRSDNPTERLIAQLVEIGVDTCARLRLGHPA